MAASAAAVLSPAVRCWGGQAGAHLAQAWDPDPDLAEGQTSVEAGQTVLVTGQTVLVAGQTVLVALVGGGRRSFGQVHSSSSLVADRILPDQDLADRKVEEVAALGG
mmetsp:Transcript_2009/g.4575  ORF Transcript_2009/g.4575 Transcript_2009/m.4575 type:complete len:107 (+) Transcript_2009:978-1298(+)